MNPNHLSPSFSARVQSQQGGMTIIMALGLLVVMSLAAFNLSRNAIRELSTTGHTIQGNKAAEASDAGLDWFIVWASPFNSASAFASTAVGNLALAKAMNDIQDPNWYGALSADGLLANASRTWDKAALITSQESQIASNDMVFDNTNTAAVLQATNSGGNPVVQRFNLQIRFLGSYTPLLTSPGGLAAGGTNPLAAATQDNFWQVISTGYAAVPAGASYIRYQQRRELIGSMPRAQQQAH